ncbi:MAG: hypothetical protein NTW71_08530 [Deltaproteobacteria bacterium]|nr:hypothetical protein [Deltaproteobacteria bacterium]
MTHSDAGRYSAKHAPGGSPDERIAGAVREKATGGELDCAEAERIAAALGIRLAEIGRTLDLLELRIGRCQLGLFGYPEGKAVHPAAAVASGLDADIRGRLADGRLPCKAAWEIASKRKVARMEVSSACESLKIRIKPCQLGAF